VSFKIANEDPNFVWDHDNAQGGRHVFTFIGETIDDNAAGQDFSITWDGTGSLIFTIELSRTHSTSSDSSQSSSSSTETKFKYLSCSTLDSSTSSESSNSSSSTVNESTSSDSSSEKHFFRLKL
jgi:hypothetical protein